MQGRALIFRTTYLKFFTGTDILLTRVLIEEDISHIEGIVKCEDDAPEYALTDKSMKVGDIPSPGDYWSDIGKTADIISRVSRKASNCLG